MEWAPTGIKKRAQSTKDGYRSVEKWAVKCNSLTDTFLETQFEEALEQIVSSESEGRQVYQKT